MAPGSDRRDDSALAPQAPYRARLEAAAKGLLSLEAVIDDAREARDLAVLEAVDAGCSYGQVARWSRLGPTRVKQIVAKEALRAQEEAAARADALEVG